MTLTVLVGIKAKPGQGDEVAAVVERLLPETREYDGCLGADALRDLDDPDAVLLLERWRDEDSHAAYGRWRAEQGAFAEHLGEIAAGPTTVRRLVDGPVR